MGLAGNTYQQTEADSARGDFGSEVFSIARRSLSGLFLVLFLTASCLAAGRLAVSFIDCGQGDCILIQFPGGKTMLVDGGPSSAGPALVSYLKSQGVFRLDALVSTHPHEDHIGGLQAVLDAFPVGMIVDSATPHTSKTYENYLTTIDRKNIPYKPGRKGMTIDLDPTTTVQVLWPVDPLMGELNDTSVILWLNYGSTSVLLLGDASSVVEAELAKDNVRAAILKVGHHGSRYSSSLAFLRAVGGKVTIISVGPNSYGHPTPETLSALEVAGYKTYRTDQRGTIRLETDGVHWTIQMAKKGAPSTGPPTLVVSTKPQPGKPQDPAKQTGNYVGSRNSNKFHYPTCRYTAAIRPGNLVEFASREDAIAKGYMPCKVCNP